MGYIELFLIWKFRRANFEILCGCDVQTRYAFESASGRKLLNIYFLLLTTLVLFKNISLMCIWQVHIKKNQKIRFASYKKEIYLPKLFPERTTVLRVY